MGCGIEGRGCRREAQSESSRARKRGQEAIRRAAGLDSPPATVVSSRSTRRLSKRSAGLDVAIVDYSLGNLSSVAGAVERLGHTPVVTREPARLGASARLILPGVGAFGDGMANLRRWRLDGVLTELVIGRGMPILGICLGAQLMARESEEFGPHRGLGWLDAGVVRLQPADPALRVPHVGWNDLFQVRPSSLFRDVPRDALFYYTHSYRIRCDSPELVIGETEYGGRLTAALERGNIRATQFHPEKSQRHGLTLLRNFLGDS